MGDKPVLSDPRWRHAQDHDTGQSQYVHQEFRLTDEDGVKHTHREEWVNRRARTDRPQP